MKKYKIGLFGLGVVGSGLYQLLIDNPQLPFVIEKVAVKNISKKRNVKIESIQLTNKVDEILENESLDFIVELINDHEEAFRIVKKAMENGKSVISANKKMIALHHQELLDLQNKYQVDFFYEGAVCGSIPIIRLLDQYFQTDIIHQIATIANGTCNYVLTKMLSENDSYDLALQKAQSLGFAESDPYADVSGEDTRFKLSILIYHAFHQFISPETIPLQGITSISEEALKFAEANNLKIKLVGEAKLINGQIHSAVYPKFITDEDDFYIVDNEFNAVLVEAENAGTQLFKGKGAGSFPTAAAVLSNLQDVSYKNTYRTKHDQKYLPSSEINSDQNELFFVSGYPIASGLSEKLTPIIQEANYLIVKATFTQLKSLKAKISDLYWIQISQHIFEKKLSHLDLV